MFDSGQVPLLSYDLAARGVVLDARQCQRRYYSLNKEFDGDVSKFANRVMADMMAEKGYPLLRLVPFVGVKRSIETISALLYAAFLDVHYLEGLTPALSCSTSTDLRVEIVTYLRLCGGRPPTTELHQLALDSSLNDLLRRTSDVQTNLKQSGSKRQGGFPAQGIRKWYY